MNALRTPPVGRRSKATTGTPPVFASVTIEPPDALDTGPMMSTDGFLLRAAVARSREAWSALFAFWTSMVMPRVLALAFAPSATETKNGLSRVLITSVAYLPPPAAVSAGLVRLQAARDRGMVVTTAKVTRVFLRMVHAFLQGSGSKPEVRVGPGRSSGIAGSSSGS